VNKKAMTDFNKSYSVFWKYRVKPQQKLKFEFEYGRRGTWTKFFGKSDKYQGSLLNKRDDEVNTYILIDIWVNKQSYDDFIKMNQEKYNEISIAFEHLYSTEENMGSFISVQ